MNSFNHDENSIFSAQQVLENRGRVAIFVDGSNLFYAALQLNIEIDYTKPLAPKNGSWKLVRNWRHGVPSVYINLANISDVFQLYIEAFLSCPRRCNNNMES